MHLNEANRLEQMVPAKFAVSRKCLVVTRAAMGHVGVSSRAKGNPAMTDAKPGTKTPPTVIGWHEAISLPDLNLQNFAIKVDTGAKTTALHAENIEVFWHEGQKWVRFTTPATGQTPSQTCEQPVLTKRDITNTSGTPERRIVIRTPMVLAGRRWRIDVSLTDRANMRFPLILGRRALRGRNIVVHPAKSYLVSDKPLMERRP